MEKHKERKWKNDAPGIKAIRMADGFPFRTVERNKVKAIIKNRPPKGAVAVTEQRKRDYQPRWW